MNLRYLLAATTLAALSATGIDSQERLASSARSDIRREASFATKPPAAWHADDPADSLYRVAREQLNRGEHTAAARTFARIAERHPQSVYAGDALYWQAYAHYSAGGATQLRLAIKALDAQRARYPKASTRGDADALLVRVRGSLAQLGDGAAAQAVTVKASEQAKPCAPGRRGDDDDDDERIAAMNALMHMNAERALPILRTVLARRDACSVGLRQKAVFLVSQQRGAETESIMLDVIASDPDHEVKKKAVFWLGQVNTDRAAQALEQLLRTSTNEDLREQAVFAIMQQNSERGHAAVRAIAEDARASENLREKAVFWLGQRRSPGNAAYLRGLFDRLASRSDGSSHAVRQKILFSLSQMRGEGNDRWLMEIAADSKHSEETRKQAIWSAGQAGVATADLMALYPKLTHPELKGQLIWVLSEKRGEGAIDLLLQIARRDPDKEMRKKAIFWLGQSNDPRVKQFLIDLINQ